MGLTREEVEKLERLANEHGRIVRNFLFDPNISQADYYHLGRLLKALVYTLGYDEATLIKSWEKACEEEAKKLAKLELEKLKRQKEEEIRRVEERWQLFFLNFEVLDRSTGKVLDWDYKLLGKLKLRDLFRRRLGREVEDAENLTEMISRFHGRREDFEFYTGKRIYVAGRGYIEETTTYYFELKVRPKKSLLGGLLK